MTAPFSIEVSDHAYWRAAERFRGFDTVTIEDEVVAAFRERRVSPTCPGGINNGSWHGSLYAWTPDGHRVYVVRCHDQNEAAFVVVTVMRV